MGCQMVPFPAQPVAIAGLAWHQASQLSPALGRGDGPIEQGAKYPHYPWHVVVLG